jgi:uncharacterized protein
MVRLFSSVLRLDEDGFYYLVTPAEKVRIQVEDSPFAAQLLEVESAGSRQRLQFITNTGERILADAEHPISVSNDPVSGAPRPRLLCRSNLRALIARSVFYQLVDLAVEHEHKGGRVVGVWSAGTFFPLEPDVH